MKGQNITTIIVVYNKNVNVSSKWLRIKSYSDVIIVDNSIKKNNNKTFCENNGVKYISMGGNKGLSKAYNKAIEDIEDTDVIVILDDDTDFSDEYFIKLRRALVDYPDVDIFVPIIRGQDGVIYSPNNYRFLKNRLVKDPKNEVHQNKFNAISSCMAIRKRVFDDYRYNEKLFVDEIDHCFCREQRDKGRKFKVLNVEIIQKFHQREKHLEPETILKRERIRVIDIFRHARLMGGRRCVFLAFIKCCGLGVQMGKKSKSIGVMIKIMALSCKLMFHDL